MSIEELKKDSQEFAQLLEQTSRQRVKNVLVTAKAEVDKEILNLEMKARLQAERKASNEANQQKRYLVELTEYAWDQSDKFVKLFVSLNDVQTLEESAVTCDFSANSMHLLVNNLNGKDYGLTVNNLLHDIDVEKSYRKIKTGIVAIYLKKQRESVRWEHLTTIQKRLKQKQEDEFKGASDSDNSGDMLMNMMKKMYTTGDAKTKQMIAKAWTESQQKIQSGDGPAIPPMEF